jgi:hypothetical protein
MPDAGCQMPAARVACPVAAFSLRLLALFLVSPDTFSEFLSFGLTQSRMPDAGDARGLPRCQLFLRHFGLFRFLRAAFSEYLSLG